MSITFRLTREKEPSQQEEFTFDDDRITVGREDANVLRLASTLVSKRHAVIARRDQNYWIEDLKSTNGTFLNNEKLIAGNARQLRIGDRIKVGDCFLETLSVGVSPAVEPPERKIEPRVVSVQTPSREVVPKKIVEPEVVNVAPPRETPDAEHVAPRVQELPPENVSQVKDKQGRAAVSRETPREPAADESQAPRAIGALKIFLRAFSKLARGRYSFFQEFVGTTSVRMRSLFFEDPEESGVEYLLMKTGTDAQASERRAALSAELDDIALHTIALLEGYRKSIDDGTRKILQRLSPDVINEELKNTSVRIGPVEISYRYLPIIRELKVRQIVRRRIDELLREDRGVLEKRFFRDGFINGYQTFLGSAKGREGKA